MARSVLRAAALLPALAALVLAWPGAAAAQQLTQVRSLSFGTCENVAGSIYTVDPAENPGPAACPGAASARYEVVGDAGRRVRIKVDKNAMLSNAGETLKVTTSADPDKMVNLDGNGELTIFIGGELDLSATVTNTGTYSGTADITVAYVGGGP